MGRLTEMIRGKTPQATTPQVSIPEAPKEETGFYRMIFRNTLAAIPPEISKKNFALMKMLSAAVSALTEEQAKQLSEAISNFALFIQSEEKNMREALLPTEGGEVPNPRDRQL